MYEDEPLFQAIKIGDRTAHNRFVVNAMECGDADKEGNPTDLTLARYEQHFKNDCSVVDLEAITDYGFHHLWIGCVHGRNEDFFLSRLYHYIFDVFQAFTP